MAKQSKFTLAFAHDLERLMPRHSPRFQALLNRSRQSIEEGKGLSDDDFWVAVRKRGKNERRRQVAAPNVRVDRAGWLTRALATCRAVLPPPAQ